MNMKIVLYLAITLNGYIAGEDDNVDWVYEGSWDNYLEKVKESDVVVVGRRTYEIMSQEEFNAARHYAVFTSKRNIQLKASNVEFVHITPKQFIEKLKKKRIVRKILVAGGSKLNSSFLKENLIDEIYLDVEPFVLGKGIPLFDRVDVKLRVKLLGCKVDNNTIQLHYKIIK